MLYVVDPIGVRPHKVLCPVKSFTGPPRAHAPTYSVSIPWPYYLSRRQLDTPLSPSESMIGPIRANSYGHRIDLALQMIDTPILLIPLAPTAQVAMDGHVIDTPPGPYSMSIP